MKTYDLRSDTLTQPTPAMREAMMSAPIGDDVYREDPSAHALEARAAELTGKEAALFVPTGTMGNQVALASWAERGQSVVCERHAHILLYELGAMSALSGLAPLPFEGDEHGCPDPEHVRRALMPASYTRMSVGVIGVEMTHNSHGGVIPALEKLGAIAEHARHAGVPVHMDGARLFNAAVALGVPASEIAQHTDSVNFCLSKGLGAPVGSVLCGPRDFIERALVVRKRFGGGMRQVGFLAAAGLHALDHHIERLAEDHERARRLALGLAEIDGLSLDPERFPTNIVYVDTDPEMAPVWERALAERGVMIHAMGLERLRFVTHLDLDDEVIDGVLERVAQVARDTIALNT